MQFGKEENREKYIRCWNRTRNTVAGRMKIRALWSAIIQKPGIPPSDPITKFQGFKHQEQLRNEKFIEFLYETPLGNTLHSNGRDRYSWPIKMYMDAIFEMKHDVEAFKQIVEEVVREMNRPTHSQASDCCADE